MTVSSWQCTKQCSIFSILLKADISTLPRTTSHLPLLSPTAPDSSPPDRCATWILLPSSPVTPHCTVHPLAGSHSPHGHVNKNSCPCIPVRLVRTLRSTHHHNIRSGWLFRIRSLATLDEAPGDSPHSYHSVPYMCQWTSRMATQTVEGRTYGAQPSVTMDQALPLVLLGIHSALKEGIACTSAQLVYGTTLRLPGECFSAACSTDIPDATSYVAKLTSTMQQLRAVQPQSHRQQRAQLSPDLQTTTHVFVWRSALRKALQHPYDGPFWVLKRDLKFFTLDINGHKNAVSLDRLKPDHLDNPCLPGVTSSYPTATSVLGSTINLLPEPQTRITRSGQRVHWPDRLVL